MEKEDRELLLKDLSARLPYRPYVLLGEKEHCILCGIDGYDVYLNVDSDSFHIESIKPYLRPMSSMTEEEGKELENLFHKIDAPCWVDTEYGCVNFAGGNDFIDAEIAEVYIDWLNSHHFDYRGLIEKGLALEAPEGMYNIKGK